MPELLLELLSEEIPARMQAAAAEQLRRLVTKELDAAGLPYTDARAYATPRRLTLVVDGLPTEQPEIKTLRKGPKRDAPDKALAGFARSIGAPEEFIPQIRKLDPEGEPLQFRVPTDVGPDDHVSLSASSTASGVVIFAQRSSVGRPTADVLGEILPDAVWEFSWPKSMRWGDKSNLIWVRPIHGIVYLFDGHVVETTLARGIGKAQIGKDLVVGGDAAHGLKTSDTTSGHRFLAPEPFKVENFKDYEAKLRQAHVMLDPQERRDTIWRGAGRIAEAQGLKVKEDAALLAEVAGLVEWPSVLMGGIDKAFMDLWSDVLVTVMRHNQKYFSLLNPDESLAPRFIVIADTEADDSGKAIVAGNERVLRARLADAKFFRDQDLSQPLENYVPLLENLVFHARLGNMQDKVRRLETLADIVGAYLPGTNPEHVRRAAYLCKADLVTQMVGEFPELQGKMGGRYAFFGPSFENPAVATAIAEHYSPFGPKDACPTATVSVAVALADKIDTLVGFFAIGERPTGSKDPFALRRAALGVIRLIIENELRIPLTTVFRSAFMAHGTRLISNDQQYVNKIVRQHLSEDQRADENLEMKWEHGLAAETLDLEAGRIAGDLLDFFADRMKVALKESGVRHDLISAVFAQTQMETASEMGMPGEVDLVRVLARVAALKDFLDTEDGANVLTAYKRAANIVRIEEKKDNKSYAGVPDEELLEAAEEIALNKALTAVHDSSDKALKEEKFAEALSALATLRPSVDAFFDHVTVNCDDKRLRENRLELLAYIRWTMWDIADFSKIEGGER